MSDILTNLNTRIVRKVHDIDHMILCDGYQYGMVTYRKEEQLVRRSRSGKTWKFVIDLNATIKEDIAREKACEV